LCACLCRCVRVYECECVYLFYEAPVCQCVSVCARASVMNPVEGTMGERERVRRPSYAVGHFIHRRHYAVRRKLGRRSQHFGTQSRAVDAEDTEDTEDTEDVAGTSESEPAMVGYPIITIEEDVMEDLKEEVEEPEVKGLDFLCLADSRSLLHPTQRRCSSSSSSADSSSSTSSSSASLLLHESIKRSVSIVCSALTVGCNHGGAGSVRISPPLTSFCALLSGSSCGFLADSA